MEAPRCESLHTTMTCIIRSRVEPSRAETARQPEPCPLDGAPVAPCSIGVCRSLSFPLRSSFHCKGLSLPRHAVLTRTSLSYSLHSRDSLAGMVQVSRIT
jgi:hypothetical protein